MQTARDQLPPHSPVGGSAIARVIKCPGSVTLSQGIGDDEQDDTFSKPGTAAHTLAEFHLTAGGDAWRSIGAHIDTGPGVFYPPGSKPSDIPEGCVRVDKEMADAVQVYLEAVRTTHPDRNQGNTWVEREFYCPELHKFFYGKADLVHLDALARTLHVWDYKHGAGIVVEVKENEQTMYYGCGALEDLQLWDVVDTVVLHIAQPRGWHWDGPIRSWSISTADLEDWLDNVCIPAMERGLVSRDTASGEHCRFCPTATRACPQHAKDMDELEALMKEIKKGGAAPKLTPEQTGRFMELFDTAKIINKFAGKAALGYLGAGTQIPGRKLAKARSNRQWKEGAEVAIKKLFGVKRAMKDVELKSPKQIEDLPGGAALVARWSFKPDNGLCVVPAKDNRMAVNRDTKSMFKPVDKKRK